MNTKKIWIISMVLGMSISIFAYITIFSKEKVSSAAEIKTSQVTKAKMDTKIIESAENDQPKKTKIPKREIKNPLVEISKGKRAISIKAVAEEGVSGYIIPNSKVDVIAFETTKDEKTNKEYKGAVLVLENVKVLTSGKASDSKEEALQYETVTLEVTPEEGVMLSLAAKDKDGFYLMLRNNDDSTTGKAGLTQKREVIKEGGK